MNKFKIVILSLLLFSLVGCGVVKEKKGAEKYISNIFETIKKGKNQKILKFYSKEFYKSTTKRQWLQILESLQNKLGKLKTYKLQNFNIRKNIGTKGVTAKIVLKYKTDYKNGSAIEIIGVKKKNGKYSIYAHKINISLKH